MNLPLSDPLDPKTVEAIRAECPGDVCATFERHPRNATVCSHCQNYWYWHHVAALLRHLAAVEAQRDAADEALRVIQQPHWCQRAADAEAELSRLRAQQASVRKHIEQCFHCQQRGVCEEVEQMLSPATTGEKRA